MRKAARGLPFLYLADKRAHLADKSLILADKYPKLADKHLLLADIYIPKGYGPLKQ